MDLWDSPRQREAYDWFTVELGQPAHGVSVGRRSRRPGRGLRHHGVCRPSRPHLENHEPIAWAEELIGPLRAVDHPRLAAVCVVASLCILVGRFEQAVHYSEVGQRVIAAASDKVSYFGEGFLGSAYLFVGQPERYLELSRATLARTGDTNTMAKANLVNRFYTPAVRLTRRR